MLRIDSDAALPVYEQIREQIVRMVVAGTLEPGTRIPTIRQLANDLQLARGTVAKAYALLESSNVVESRGHKGTFIAASWDSSTSDAASITADLSEAADAYIVTARQLGVGPATAIDELRQRWDLLSDPSDGRPR